MSVFISSPSNPKVKDIVQLTTKARARKSRGCCVVEGYREIDRALLNGWKALELWTLDGTEPVVSPEHFADHYVAHAKVFDKIAYRSSTEHAVAVFHTPDVSLSRAAEVLRNARGVLVLEGIEKPGNLGAVLRTALAAGVDAVILADPALDPFGPNVIRNATGALFEAPLFVGGAQEVRTLLLEQGFTTFITHMHEHASSLFEVQWPEKSAIVLGEESRGLHNDWLDCGYENVVIPMASETIDSLNVSVAAAVLMYQWKSSLG
ncbi:MAG: 23S rRNA (adenosine(1067)-2'-O)-methyltransferase [Cryomorphaceae bacterium]|nr:MAG: 23S rRNA (adenosine(1067)-2'-O)-methyltransferase [Cryomorphaceae bacterium]